MVTVRVLSDQDAAVFRTLRLRALKEHPEAYGSAFEEEEQWPLEQTVQGLTQPSSSAFGAFAGTDLVGIASLARNMRAKTRHRAMLTGMYVAPEVRGRGVGLALMDAVLASARTVGSLEDVVLAVTVGNESARRLYLKAGFVSYSVDPRYIKIDDRYYDIEWMILRIAKNGR